MDIRVIIWLILVLMMVVGVVLNLRSRQQLEKPKCPFCESEDVVEVDRDTVGNRMIQTSYGGTGAGGDIRLELEYEVKYRCGSCGEHFKKRIRQTQ